MEYLIYKDGNGYFRWHLTAGNNRIIANSGEGYYNENDCWHAIQLVKDSKDAPVYRHGY